MPRLSRWPGLMDVVEATGADLLITGATLMIVPDPLLARFGPRAVNIHPALLPAYRGPTPYLPMLLDGRGDADGGVTLHVLSAGIDEGDIIAQEAVPYTAAGARFGPWYAELILASYRLMRDALPRYLAGEIAARPQGGEASYPKLHLPLLLRPDSGAGRVREMLERGGSTMQIAVEVPGRKRPVRVSQIVRQEPRSGRSPRLRPLSVEMDFADARLTMKRLTGIERRLESWRLASALGPLQL